MFGERGSVFFFFASVGKSGPALLWSALNHGCSYCKYDIFVSISFSEAAVAAAAREERGATPKMH